MAGPCSWTPALPSPTTAPAWPTIGCAQSKAERTSPALSQLARRHSWAADRRALERLANVRFLPNVKDIDEVLARTRVLLNPSLWYEGRSEERRVGKEWR